MLWHGCCSASGYVVMTPRRFNRYLKRRMIYSNRTFRNLCHAVTVGVALLGLGALIGCSTDSSTNTPVPADKALVVTSTSMDRGTISASSTFSKTSPVSEWNGTTADSITITRARIVISAMKLHLDGDDDSDHDKDGHWHDGGTIKTGPFVAEFDSSGERIISSVTIPPGTYDRIKFEIHKLNENEDASLLNDPLFGDFVNGGRYTVIIDGHSYVNGVSYGFSFKSSLTVNVQVFFNPAAVFDSTQTYDLTLAFDPKIVFGRPGLRPLDPRDPDNQHILEAFIKDAIRALRNKR